MTARAAGVHAEGDGEHEGHHDQPTDNEYHGGEVLTGRSDAGGDGPHRPQREEAERDVAVGHVLVGKTGDASGSTLAAAPPDRDERQHAQTPDAGGQPQHDVERDGGHGEASAVNAGTLPQPEPACNPPAHLTTAIEHADAMLAYLRSVPAGYGHELARAMLASSTFYLRETFGQQHALAMTADLVAPLAVSAEPVVPDPQSVEVPVVTLH